MITFIAMQGYHKAQNLISVWSIFEYRKGEIGKEQRYSNTWEEAGDDGRVRERDPNDPDAAIT